MGWWFDKHDYEDRVQEPPKSFFFQNRLVAATPGRQNRTKMSKIQIENGEFAKLLGEHYPNQRSSFRDLINKFETLFEIIILLQDCCIHRNGIVVSNIRCLITDIAHW